MDAVLLLDEGRMVDTGSHDELMERSPAYRRLLNVSGDASALEEQACA